MDASQTFLRPPAESPLSYDEATSGSLWYRPQHGGDWGPLRLCTDEEASYLSGVPERSLRLLQAERAIDATLAQLPNGRQRRLWHLPEVVVAAVIDRFRKATNLDFRTAGAIFASPGVMVRSAFFSYCKIDGDRSLRDKLAIDFILANNTWIYFRYSEIAARLEPELIPVIGRDGLRPVGFIHAGKFKPIEETAERRTSFMDLYGTSAFEIQIHLTAIFRLFESNAKKLRI